MTGLPKTFISEETYLEEERKASFKSEYFKGEIFAMAGASRDHNAIVASILGELYGFLKGKSCKVYPSDLRVHNSENSLYTYPDVTIVCGKEEYSDDQFDTLLNPTVLIEVLSPATEMYDRGAKFKLYRSIPSLQNYVMVSSTEFSAEVYSKAEEDSWIFTMATGKTGYIHISAINYDLLMSDIYAQIAELIS